MSFSTCIHVHPAFRATAYLAPLPLPHSRRPGLKIVQEPPIPLGGAAARSPRVAEAAAIRSFPTLVCPGPDGHVLGGEGGFLAAAAFGQLLQPPLKASPPVGPKPPAPVVHAP